MHVPLNELYKQYDRPQITIKADHSLEQWAKSFATLHPSLSIEAHKGEATISASSIRMVQQLLFTELSSGKIAIRSIVVGTTALEVSIGTIKSRLNNGLTKLRKELDEHE